MTTDERLENLERELARAKRRNSWLMAAVALGAGVVILAAAWIVTPEKVLAENAAKKFNVIHANGFILEDENGKGRAALAVTKDGPGLWLSDENGRVRVGLNATKDGPAISLGDENGTIRTALGAGQTIAPDGRKITYPESSVRLSNPEGKVIWSAP